MADEENDAKPEEKEDQKESESNLASEEVESTDPAKTERSGADNLRVLENIDVTLTVEVGSASIRIRDLLRLNDIIK